jgi:predicted dienelactone hydrolase
MKTTIGHPRTTAGSSRGTTPVRRFQVTVALVAATLGLGLYVPGVSLAAAAGGPAQVIRVGHALEPIEVPDAYCTQPLDPDHLLCPAGGDTPKRQVEVHVWFPVDSKTYASANAHKTIYTSQLKGRLPNSKLLTWTVPSEISRDVAATSIDRSGPSYPVIVFSHGSQNDPIDYAPTLERLAGQGFVVAAPYHVNNTQDDVRTDFINSTPANPQLACRVNPNRPGACSRDSLEKWLDPNVALGNGVAFDMADRVNDISAVLDTLPEWFGDRVDVARAGVLGHSRGTVTALAAAGGSVDWTSTLNCQSQAHAALAKTDPPPCWPVSSLNSAKPGGVHRIKAVMGLAIGGLKITPAVQFANVDVPTLLVAGEKDKNSLWSFSRDAFDLIPSQDKAFVSLANGVHRSFDSNYCAEAQAAGATADKNTDGRVDDGELSQWMSQALLDRQTLTGIVGVTVGPTGQQVVSMSGTAMQYCPSTAFTTPVDITPVVNAVSGGLVRFVCVNSDSATQRCTDYHTCVSPDINHLCTPVDEIPTTGLDTVEVQQGVTELAASFFGTVLKGMGNDGPHFTRYLAPKWLEKHEPMVNFDTVTCASTDSDAIQPPGQQPDPQPGQKVECPD